MREMEENHHSGAHKPVHKKYKVVKKKGGKTGNNLTGVRCFGEAVTKWKASSGLLGRAVSV